MATVVYAGTSEQWSQVTVGTGNSILSSITCLGDAGEDDNVPNAGINLKNNNYKLMFCGIVLMMSITALIVLIF